MFKIACRSGLLALGLLFPCVASAQTLAYRASGTACHPDDFASNVSYASSYGIRWGWASGGVNPDFICPIPLGQALVSLNSSDPNELAQVNLRYHVFNDSINTITARLVYHDFDSTDYVECDSDEDSNAMGYQILTVVNSCSGYATSWGANVHFDPTGLSIDSTTTLTQFSVYY